MIHIFPTHKVKVDPRAERERLLVCTQDEHGNLRIMGLGKYLKKGRQQKGQGRGIVKSRHAVEAAKFTST